ncbi:uncharacterized protein K02A2.6-like [Gigantopelta aegis]|uniref:uncharacterized protein K02A2.6-like n=1 Tax=Gigantopelta aegis TaxID=1735272 RepID=UPI001B88E149|nr:uncharacterized protein K02A2.6-like [Gigantopelta aegis]
MIGVDICEFKGNQYLITVDYYSRYIDIAFLSQITSFAVICKMKNVFAHHGIPEIVVLDNGRQFVSAEFRKFAIDWNFKHVTTSPYYPQANGEAERAVRTAKEILKQEDMILALLIYRATPISALGMSPAELVYGRRLRITLPSMPSTLVPRTIDYSIVRGRDSISKIRQKKYFNR